MSKYIVIIVWIGLVSILANVKEFNGRFQRRECVSNEIVKRYVPWFALLVFVPLIWMAGNRGWIADTGAYIGEYLQIPRSIGGIADYIMTVKKDKGFYLFSALIKLIVGNNYIIYLTILAIIQGISIVTIFRKYSNSYLLSIFLFVVSTDYISWMFNGLRQFMAVTIIFAATPLMLRKKYTHTIAVILLASLMHQSALLMIPLVFVAQGKAWNRKTLMFIGIAILGIVFVGRFTDFLDVALEETQYANIVSDAEMFEDDGTNPIRVAVYSVPAILAFVGRKKIRKANNPLIDFCTNMSIISMGLYLISMVTSGVFLGRLPIYVSLYGYILLPWEIDNLFNGESRKIVYSMLIVCYLLFYYYQMHFAWGLL